MKQSVLFVRAERREERGESSRVDSMDVGERITEGR
jgi:hypothetical protein